jgi:hypothetical protein
LARILRTPATGTSSTSSRVGFLRSALNTSMYGAKPGFTTLTVCSPMVSVCRPSRGTSPSFWPSTNTSAPTVDDCTSSVVVAGLRCAQHGAGRATATATISAVVRNEVASSAVRAARLVTESP